MVAIGYVLSQEQHPVPELIEIGVAAEKAGFEMVWTSDHFLPWQDNQGHAGQAWITLAALGQEMPRITMGTGVTCPTYRYNPAIVAQSFASLAQLYPGRVFLGVGSGEAINEQTTTGQWGSYSERAERLVEAIEIIRQLWSGAWVNYSGRYYQVGPAKLYNIPHPPVPIYVAAAARESMYLTGQYGDGLIAPSRKVVDPELRAEFRRGARDAGKNPDALSIHAEIFVVVGTEAEAREGAKQWRFLPKSFEKFHENPDPREIQRQAEAEISLDEVIQGWVVSEDPTAHLDKIQELAAAGVTHVYIHSPQPDQQRVIDFYSRNILPQIQPLAMEV